MHRPALRTATQALRAKLASRPFLLRSVARAACAVALVPAALAAQIRNGFLQQQLNVGDDLTRTVSLGFNVNLSGNEGDLTTVCANGFLIFGGTSVRGACAIPGALAVVDKNRGEGSVLRAPTIGTLVGTYGNVLIPYFADLDATQLGSGQVFVGSGSVNGRAAFAVTYNGVFGFGGGGPNFFQTVFINRGLGNFDFEFNYGLLSTPQLRIGYGDDGGFTGFLEAQQYIDAGIIPTNLVRISGSFVNGVSPTAPGGSGLTIATIPEPATVALLGAGLLAVGVGARRRRTA
jgi:hypothetical protein